MGLSQAIQYVQRGWSVVPIPRGEKHPVGMSWDEFKTRRPTQDEVRAWIAKGGEEQNVGIITGAVSGLVVVDADGASAIRELAERGINSPLRVATSKGQHLYFAHPGGTIKNAVRITGSSAEGVDIRADGGLVVAPPSIHASGRLYQWIGNPQTQLPVYDPAWFTSSRLITRREPGWVATALTSMGPGNRDSLLASVVGKMMRDGWKDDEVRAMLGPHPEVIAHGLPELDRIIKSVRRYHSRPQSTAKVFGVKQLLDLQQHVEWLVESLIPKQATMIIGGEQGLGKSWMLLDLAFSLASGTPWMGLFPTQKATVLYVDEENAPQLVRERVQKLLSARPELNAEDLPVHFRIGQGLDLTNDESRGLLVQQIRELKPTLVIIDSLVRSNGAEENSASEMRRVFAQVKRLMDEFGTSFVFADHEAKGAIYHQQEQRAPSAQDLRGSNEKAAFADAVLSVRKKEGSLQAWHTKSRWGKSVATFRVFIEDVPGQEATTVRGVRYDA